MDEIINDFGLSSACLGVSVLVCWVLARSRGYSGLFYASLAIFLSYGAIPLTFLATLEPYREEEPVALGFSPASPEAALKIDPDLASWRRLYRAIRDSLLFGGLGAAVVGVLAFGYAVTSILPTFVALFEGMSLALPLPTQVLIAGTKFCRNPDFAPLFWFAKSIWPAALFFVLSRTGYWFPLLGGVWKSADRLWQIQATRIYGNQWRLHVPSETSRRLFGAEEISLPAEEADYQAVVRRQREALQASLWMLLPGALPAVGIALVLVWLIGLSVFLPLYQIIGNIGG